MDEEMVKDFERHIDYAIAEMSEFGYVPHYFIKMRRQHGTINAIKKLIHKTGTPKGFITLWENNRPDLSMEHIIQDSKWNDLFTDEDRSAAKKRLKASTQR